MIKNTAFKFLIEFNYIWILNLWLAQSGCMFSMFEQLEESQEAYDEMNGRKYDGNELKIVYIKE